MQKLFFTSKKCIFLVLITLVTAPKSINTMGYSEAAQTGTIPNINLPYSLAITATEATMIATPAIILGPEETLILVLGQDKMYNYALVKGLCPLDKNYVLVYNFYTKETELHPINSTYTLMLVPKLKYQPYPPHAAVANFCQNLCAFYEKVRWTNKLPFFVGRIIPASSHIISIGDLHGDSKALINILRHLYSRKIIDEKGILAPDYHIVFTGDLTDRGPHGPEVWFLVAKLNRLNPHSIFITRGNHETIKSAYVYNFLRQIEEYSKSNSAATVKFLSNLFATLPHGLLFGIAPKQDDYRENAPYHFLLFCHGGHDPVVPLRRFIQQMTQAHKKTGKTGFCHSFSHPHPEHSGFLWTDYRANRSFDEPSLREPSSRGKNLHLFNRSAILDFFEEHNSAHPQYPYVLDALIRGHQHIANGIGRLNEYTTSSNTYNWHPLSNNTSEIIEPSSVYTCISSTKWALASTKNIISYLDIGFYEDDQIWHLTSYIDSKTRKRPTIQGEPYQD